MRLTMAFFVPSCGSDLEAFYSMIKAKDDIWKMSSCWLRRMM
jgi:hypothetical protein